MAYGTTVDALLERVRRDAILGSRGPIFTLAADPGASGVTLTLNESQDLIGAGSIVAIETELCLVQETNSASRQLTVLRGHLGTTATAHAIGSLVEGNPRFPKGALIDYAQNEILSWGNELWRTTVVDLSVVTTQRSYDLAGVTGDVYFLLDVRLKPVGTSINWWYVNWTQDAHPHADARLLREANTTDYPSGYNLQLLRAPRFDTTARVAVAQPVDLSTFTAATDLISDVGLEAPWIEVVELGTRMRALSGSGAARTDWRQAGMSAETDHVSVFDLLRSTQHAEAMRHMRFTKVASDLRARWPFRRGA